MEEELSMSVTLHEEELEDGKVFVSDCVELGVSDFGDTIDEAINNLKNGINLLLREAPEKRKLLQRKEPGLVTRVSL
ncbi:MAG: type II toxin-antitoxin system HicB family antitoxin [Nanoarchaeota archaeon]